MTDVMIYEALRTPRGKGRADTGALAEVSPVELAAVPLRAVIERSGLDPARVDDVVLGCVDPIRDQGGDIARTAALAAGYGESVPGVVVSRFCASGLEAVAVGTGKIASGEADFVVASGVEMMSRISMLSSGVPVLGDPGLAPPMQSLPQGISADLIATRNGHSRDDVDAYAVESQRRAARAWDEGRFAASVVPVADRLGLLILDHRALDHVLRRQAPVADARQTLGAAKPGHQADSRLGQTQPQARRVGDDPGMTGLGRAHRLL